MDKAGFKPDFVGQSEDLSNSHEDENLRLVYLIYFNKNKWINEQDFRLQIGTNFYLPGKRTFKMVDPRSNPFSFIFGKFAIFFNSKNKNDIEGSKIRK